MCTVILGWQLRPDAPVVLAANRDELLARPSDPPMLLADDPPRWGGRDRIAGGTWLAVDPEGRIAAVTNRHPGGRPPARDSTRKSRGRLPLDALAGDDKESRTWAESLEAQHYNPVNIVYASPTDAWCLSLDDTIGRRMTDLDAGVHVLTEQNVDDPSDAKTRALLTAARETSSADDLVAAWRTLLQPHEASGEGSPPCIHGEIHGTVSSATVLVTRGGDGRLGVRYEHAEGPPCRTPYRKIL